jgi:hypothetical protein
MVERGSLVVAAIIAAVVIFTGFVVSSSPKPPIKLPDSYTVTEESDALVAAVVRDVVVVIQVEPIIVGGLASVYMAEPYGFTTPDGRIVKASSVYFYLVIDCEGRQYAPAYIVYFDKDNEIISDAEGDNKWLSFDTFPSFGKFGEVICKNAPAVIEQNKKDEQDPQKQLMRYFKGHPHKNA